MTLDLYERALAGASRARASSACGRPGDAVAGRSRGTLRDMRLRSGLLALVLCVARFPAPRALAASPAGTLAQTAGAGGCASTAGRARVHRLRMAWTTPGQSC